MSSFGANLALRGLVNTYPRAETGRAVVDYEYESASFRPGMIVGGCQALAHANDLANERLEGIIRRNSREVAKQKNVGFAWFTRRPRKLHWCSIIF